MGLSLLERGSGAVAVSDRAVVRTISFAQTKGRLASIDILRAFACVWVIGYHAWSNLSPAVAHSLGAFGLFLSQGYLGVHLFLVLSGYCVFASVAKGQTDRNYRFDAKTFYARRFRRLYPAYLGALGILTALHLAASHDLRAPLPLAEFLASHLLLIHNYVPSMIYKVDGPMWTLALEAQLYLLMPLMVRAVNRFGWGAMLGGTLALSALYQVGLGLAHAPLEGIAYYALPGRMFEFAAGMAAYAVFTHRSNWPTRWIAAAMLVLPLNLFRSIEFGHFGVMIDQVYGVGFAALLLVTLRSKALRSDSRALRLMETVGAVSYSVYLLHQPLLTAAWLPALHRLAPRLSGQGVLAATMLLFVPAVCLLGRAFWSRFERPYLKPASKPIEPCAVVYLPIAQPVAVEEKSRVAA